LDNLFFFPTITQQLLRDAGCVCEDYRYGYFIEGAYHSLIPKGKRAVRLEDALDAWKIEIDGLRIHRRIIIEYPKLLQGKTGVACIGAELGVCIIWNNKSLSQMGYILPQQTSHEGNKLVFDFLHLFPPGEIKGDLLLDTVLYIKTAAKTVLTGEEALINEAGVTVGIIDSTALDFDSEYMDFPVRDVKESSQPLWWLELNQWDDPTQNSFTEDYVCLYLNSYYDYCPKVGDVIKNKELLIEIVSTAYLLIFLKIDDMGFLNRTINNVNLEPGSISMVMYYFYSSCDPDLKVECTDLLQKTIRQNIEKMLMGVNEV